MVTSRHSRSAEEIQRIIDIWDKGIPFHALQYRNPIMRRIEKLSEPFDSLERTLDPEESDSLLEQWQAVLDAAERTVTQKEPHLELALDFTRKAANLRTELGRADAERVLWLFVEQCRTQEHRNAGWCGTGALVNIHGYESRISDALERGGISLATRIAARWMYERGRSAADEDDESFGLSRFEDLYEDDDGDWYDDEED